MLMSVVLPWRQETWIAAVHIYIYSIRRHRPLKWLLLPMQIWGSVLFFTLWATEYNAGNWRKLPFFSLQYFRDIRFIIWGCVWDSGSRIYVCYAVRSLVWYWLTHWHLREVWGIQQVFNNPVGEIKQNYSLLRFVLIFIRFSPFLIA